jgi:hypothetical protein
MPLEALRMAGEGRKDVQVKVRVRVRGAEMRVLYLSSRAEPTHFDA